MRIYELRPPDDSCYYIEAKHRWGLPGVKCGTCGATWGSTGVSYPTVDLSSMADAARYETQWPVSWEEFESLRRVVLPLLPPGLPMPPGTALGPLVGTIEGLVDSVVWRDPWTLLFSEGIFTQLKRLFPTLAGRAALLRGMTSDPGLVEPQIEPWAQLSMSSSREAVDPPCGVCGRIGLSRPDRLVLRRDSIPLESPFFRPAGLSTVILAPGRTLAALERLETDGYRAIEVELE
jgi:uncharacterized double-CXXCG motif protein